MAYLYAKRMYGQGTKTKYAKYLEAVTSMKDKLINNPYVLADKEFYEKIKDLIA